MVTSAWKIAWPRLTDNNLGCPLHRVGLALEPAAAATDDALRLQGYDLVPRTEQPEHLTLRLFWETGDGPARDWITYIHLTDAQGNLVAQFDGPAF